jgi:hypothetical protein
MDHPLPSQPVERAAANTARPCLTAARCGSGGEAIVRARGIRAFPDKAGGWTLIGAGGEGFALRNAASVAIWESLAAGAREAKLLDQLAHRFPRVARERLARDLGTFLEKLEERGFIVRPQASGSTGIPPLERPGRTC